MDEPRPDSTIRLDSRAVRALAHPLRSRILSRLRTHGPATATELASALGTNTGATSYHLRALADVGLVTDTGGGEGRRREWRAASERHSWVDSDFAGDEDARTALAWLSRDYVRQFAVGAERWLDAAEHWPAEWVDVLGLSDGLLTVTPEQTAAFSAELAELMARYRDAGAADPRARRIHVSSFATPLDLDDA